MPNQTQQSSRLRADVGLHATAHGHVLRVGDAHHHVHLSTEDADALLDALVDGGDPRPALARRALGSLVDAGLVDPAPAHVSVAGDGALATTLTATLTRMGVTVGLSGSPALALDSPDDLPAADVGAACWIDEHLVVLAPPGVPARDVAARRRAATRHRDTDPATAPVDGGRAVTAAPTPSGLELAAAVVAAELLRAGRPTHEAVAIDLRTLTVIRHPVLPVPRAPR